MKITITGGAGFVGSHLTEALVKRGDKVTVLDNFSTGKRENLSAVQKEAIVLEGDTRDQDAMMRALKGAEAVFHLAAQISVSYSFEHPLETHDVNARAALAALLAALQSGVKRLIFASSAAVYGDSGKSKQAEDDILMPLSPYAIQKITGENYLRVLGEPELCAVSLRYFNIFGPRQDESSPYAGVITKFIQRMLRGQRPVIYGDGSATRDFVYIDDVVRANLKTLEAPRSIGGERINIATGRPVSVTELSQTLNTILGASLEPIFEKEREGDIRHSLADTTKSRNMLAYEPQTAFEEGLKKTVDWYRHTLDA